MTRLTTALSEEWKQLAYPTDVQQSNVRNVLIDGIGVGLVSGVSTFLAVFLARMGASPFLVGLLTAMPALTGMILALPIGRMLERQKNVVPWYTWARAITFLCYALTGLVPFVVPLEAAPEVIIAIWAAATIPQTIVSIAFTVVMGAAAGPRRRQYLMSRRWSVLGTTTAITVALVGLFLDYPAIAFPLNYQILFIASFLGAMVSFLFSQRIVIPDNPPLPEEGQARVSLGARLREQLDVVRGSPAFGAFVICSFVFNLGMTMAMPLFPLYWVRELQAPDTWIGLIATVNNGITMLGYFLWVAVGKRRGNVFVLRFCAFGLGFYPLLAALTPSVPPQMIYAGMAGIFGAGLNLVLFDISLATVPPDRVPSSIALYQVTTFVATLVAPLIGTTIAGLFGYSVALIVAAVLRFAGAALFVALGVGAAQPAGGKS